MNGKEYWRSFEIMFVKKMMLMKMMGLGLWCEFGVFYVCGIFVSEVTIHGHYQRIKNVHVEFR